MMISHIVCTSKILTDLCFTKQKIKTKTGFVGVVYSVLVVRECVDKALKIENCLRINGKQTVKLEKWIINFENHFKQIPAPFKIYADFECNLKGVESCEGSNIKITFLIVLLIKLFVLMISLLRELLFIEVKIQLMDLWKQFLRSINIAKM